jgi:hypothetical protein
VSDLQCAATVLVLHADDEARSWLAGERVALVYDGAAGDPRRDAAGGDQGDGGSVQALARGLGVGARTLDVAVTRAQVQRREPVAVRALQELADVHRGETVVLAVAEPGPLVEVRIDGDGLVMQTRSPR